MNSVGMATTATKIQIYDDDDDDDDDGNNLVRAPARQLYQ
jgi:hypothetical protein